MKHLKPVVLALIIASASSYAKAETYVTAGFGQVQINHQGDGYWSQEQGWNHEEREKTPSFHVGLGYEFKPWLSGEVLYHDLGSYSMFAGFGQSDAEYQETKGDCDCKTSWGYGTAEVKGLSLTALPSISVFDARIYARLGMVRYHADWHESYTKKGAASARSYNVLPSKDPYGWSPLFGAGVEYNRVRLEYVVMSQVMPKESAIKKVNYINIGYRF